METKKGETVMKAKQLKAIKVTDYVKKLSLEVTKKVAADIKVDVSINAAMQYVFEQYLEKGK
jgi:hypothetical protein